MSFLMFDCPIQIHARVLIEKLHRDVYELNIQDISPETIETLLETVKILAQRHELECGTKFNWDIKLTEQIMKFIK